VKVRLLHDEYEAWDTYVNVSKNSTFFHQTGWKTVVEKTYPHKPYYLFVEHNGDVRGILPMFLVESWIYGKFLVSAPYAVYGGVCAEDEEAENLLFNEAFKIANETGAKYIELRNRNQGNHSLPFNDIYVTFRAELPATKEECLKNLPKDARRGVRKAIEHGLEMEIGVDEQLDAFYNIYAITMQNLGSPVYPFSLIKNIVAKFHDQLKIFYVMFQDKIAACGMVFFFKDSPLGYYGGSLKEYRYYYINNFLYIKVMEYGVENGYKFMDYGRSRKGTGTFTFKKNWGVEPEQLYYQYYLHKADHIPQVNPSNPKYDIPKKIWQKLPLGVTKWIGPKITKNLP